MMWHALVWTLVALVLALWSGVCWILQLLLTGPDWSQADPQAWTRWLTDWSLPAWLVAWLPMSAITALQAWMTAWVSDWAPLLETVLAQVPTLLAWAVPLVWLGWGVGALMLLTTGVGGSVLVVALRGRRAATA
ncbi:MAG: hypothetical protein JNL87_12800 [Burkholderiaceae bacterium]|nr:hypothetical protein [Burkholderiaceae bacterium]